MEKDSLVVVFGIYGKEKSFKKVSFHGTKPLINILTLHKQFSELKISLNLYLTRVVTFLL